jgi:hypothetical protein
MTGDQNDMLGRLKAVLPAQWFGDVTPVLDSVLSGLASGWSALFKLMTAVSMQARIATASGIFLDIASNDYFGNSLPRREGENDPSFSQRLRVNLIAPRATRAALAAALESLTGRAPVIFEPLNANDTGGYGAGSLGYNVAGGYGCRVIPFQFFVTAFRPNASPVSNAGGYCVGPGGYGTAPMFYADLADVPGATSDADIFSAAAAVLPTAYTAWMNISN